MPPRDRRPAAPPTPRLLACLAACLFGPAPASAEPPAPPPLRLDGMMPAGMRVSATETWGTWEVDVANLTDVDRPARVAISFEGRPEVQYARDLWVPARTTATSWMLVGPATAQHYHNASDIQVLLYDLSGGDERLVLPPGEERVRGRPGFFQKREPYTVVVADDPPGRAAFGALPRPESVPEEALLLAHALRGAASLSDVVHVVRPDDLPPTAEAFDGIDHCVIASDAVAQNPAGVRSLRRWLERGGRALVMLDRVGPGTLAAILGGAPDFEVAGGSRLTDFAIETHPAEGRPPPPLAERHDRAVDLVRVLLPPGERPRHTVGGWPAWFVRPVGRGKVVFTALGPRGWFRPRRPGDAGPPAGNDPLGAVATELCVTQEAPFRADALHPLLAEDIGYKVVGRGAVALIFGGFLLAALAAGLVLRRARRREVLGWLGPAAALGAAAVLAAVGAASRGAVPPTVAVAEVVEVVPGADEAPARGALAVYRPDSGPFELGSRRGGLVEPDAEGAEASVRRLRLTDLDAWRWDGLSPPAGVHYASFRAVLPTGGPVSAVAHFGPDGLEGRLTAGALRGLADAVVAPAAGRDLAVRLAPDGAFRVGPADVLPAGQYLAGAVLTDRQQRRQEALREYLRPPAAAHPVRRDEFLVWADAIDPGLDPAPAPRTVGSALVVVPLRLERPAAGARVVVPGPFVACQRIIEGAPAHFTAEGTAAAEMELRFQPPAESLPLQVDHARLTARIDAPGRRVVVAGLGDAGPVELFRADSPLDVIRLDIDDPRLLRTDGQGGLRLNVSLGEAPAAGAGQPTEKWAVEYMELEIAGTMK